MKPLYWINLFVFLVFPFFFVVQEKLPAYYFIENNIQDIKPPQV